ncbi:FAD-dependent oxidoreductase [Nocardioides nanhaiensis]|uniref:FAD-dependent oxidoreductase n=1 Tax=Nocardioides nanhaiensis TaxID=1476871 RepID=A0ABP8WQT3_9ACTN
MSRVRVVVAGLGDAGVLAALHLARHRTLVEVVGISARPGLVSGQELGLRLARPDAWAREYRVPFDRFRGLDGVRTVHASLTGLDLTQRRVHLRTAAGEQASEPYDVLVVATGVANGFWRHGTLERADELDEALAAAHARVAAARTVAVVGGGAAAVATAAQLAQVQRASVVTLYFPGEHALPHHHRRVWAQVRARLERLGVRLRPGHRAVLPPEVERGEETGPGEGPVRFSTGQEPVDADAVVWAVGRVRPHTAWLPPELLDEQGFVQVDPTLQVPGQADVWAVGDVAATDPLRTSARNQGGQLVARNVVATVRGRPARAYRPPRRRWGSVLGPMDDGLVVFTPGGRGVRIPRRVVDHALQPWVVRRGIYRGIRATR